MIGALLFAALVFATRVPFRSRFAFNWDAANFALAVQHFDVRLHQPHPPGYPYYVALGALFNTFTRQPNGSLVIVTILLECLAAGALYLLARRMFSLWPAIVVTLGLVLSVTFWTYGEVALAYPALAAFCTLVALFVYETRIEGKDRLVWAAAAYAVGTGFRPDLALFLLPLLAFGAWGQPRRNLVLAGAVAFGGILLWLLPVMALSGGPAGYLEAFAAYFGRDVIERYAPSSSGLSGLVVNVRDTVTYLGYALYANVVIVAGIALLAWKRPVGREWLVYGMLAAWVSPMALFYVFLHIGDPGYVFGMLPALLLAGVGGWRALAGPQPGETLQTVLGGGAALAFLANGLLFWGYDRPLTLPGLRQHDTQTQARLQFVQGFNPDETLVVSYDSYKHFKLYTPRLTHNAWLDTQTPARQDIEIPAGVQQVVFTDPSVFIMLQSLPAQADYLAGDTWAARLPVRPGQRLVYQNGQLRIEG